MNAREMLRVGGRSIAADDARRLIEAYLNGARGQYGYPSYDGYRTNDDPNRLADGDLLAPVLLNVGTSRRALTGRNAVHPVMSPVPPCDEFEDPRFGPTERMRPKVERSEVPLARSARPWGTSAARHPVLMDGVPAPTGRPMGAPPLPTRRVRFAYPEDLREDWNPRRPEFSFAANSVSMLMPHVEPLFVRVTRAALPDLPEELRPEAEAYVRQEAQHHAQHRRFNDLLIRRCPGLARLERWMDRAYGAVERRRSLRFNLAFAAASETMAFSLARWTDRRARDLFDGADPVAASLYLWHLAEEVEHKSVAFDVWKAVDGSRRRYVAAMATSLVLLGAFTWLGTMVMLKRAGRLFSPLSHLRLVIWAVSVAFTILPDAAVSIRKHHHPTQMADPILLSTWLRGYDPATRTMPLWSTGVAA
jgi:predicted metal-dependent hydrolase